MQNPFFSTGKLPLDGIMLLLEHLAKLGMIEWKSPDKQSFTIFYYNPMEIAELMYKWVELIPLERQKFIICALLIG